MNQKHEVVTVNPPPHSELQFTSHWICCAQSFWFTTPHCIGIQQTGTCCCCTGAAMCRLGSFAEADACMESYGSSFCISLSQCKEKGFTEAIWCAGSGRGTSCFLCQSKQQFQCQFPKTCCKCAVQECCCEYRVAIPPDEDVPVACSCCGKWFKEPEKQPTGWNGVPDQASGSGDNAPAQENMNPST